MDPYKITLNSRTASHLSKTPLFICFIVLCKPVLICGSQVYDFLAYFNLKFSIDYGNKHMNKENNKKTLIYLETETFSKLTQI